MHTNTLPTDALPSASSHPAEALVLARVSTSVRERAAGLRLMVFDVDGTLTDGSLWYSEAGEVCKRFHALDGYGLQMLIASGLRVALMTGRGGGAVARRAAELGIADVVQDCRDKGAALTELANHHHIALQQTGYMGDDLIDLPAMQKAGFAASVASAPSYVAQVAHWLAAAPAGQGAARECCDLILAAQGRLAHFFSPERLGLMDSRSEHIQ